MRYLSPEWITAADLAVRESGASAPAGRVVIDQLVDGANDYRVTIDGTASSVRLIDSGTTTAPDASFSQSRDTAVAVAQGTTDAHQAFLLGHIRFGGDVSMLIEHRAAFDWLQETLAPLVAQTLF